MALGFRDQTRELVGSFRRIDKRFLQVALFEVLLIALLLLGIFVWNKTLMAVGGNIEAVQNQINAVGGLTSYYGVQIRDDAAVEIFSKFLFSTIILILYLLLAWTLIKNKIYNIVNKVSFSKHTYWRFIIISIIWAVISFFIFTVWQFFVYLLFGSTFETSFLSRMSVFFLLSVIVLTLFWWTINLLTHLVNEGKILAAIRGLYVTGIKGFGGFIIPLIFSIVVLLVVNALMYLILLLRVNPIFVVLSTVLVILYLTWLRFYYTQVMFRKQGLKAQVIKNEAGEKRPEEVVMPEKPLAKKGHRKAVKAKAKKK